MKSLQRGLRDILGGSWGRLGPSLGTLGGSWMRLGTSLGARGGLQMACARQMEGLGRVQGPPRNEKSMFLFDPELTKRYAHRCFSVCSFFPSFFEFVSFVCLLFLVCSICFHVGGPSDDLEGALEVLGGCVREIRGSKESPGHHI